MPRAIDVHAKHDLAHERGSRMTASIVGPEGPDRTCDGLRRTDPQSTGESGHQAGPTSPRLTGLADSRELQL
jgi:hypothetical protein